MAIPDPRTFFGKKCVIRLKGGALMTMIVRSIDTSGVIVETASGGTATYPFEKIERVHLAKR